MPTDPEQVIIHEDTFATLVESASAGSQSSWVELVQHFHMPLQRYAASQGVNDPEDIVGEVWVSAARNIHKFEGSYTQFRSWLFTIAHSRIVDTRRATARKPSEPLTPAKAAKAPAHVSAESEVMETFSEAELQKVLDGLPSAQRDVITLRFVGGFTHVEIAEMLGKSVGAVHSLQRRAYKNLRKALRKP